MCPTSHHMQASNWHIGTSPTNVHLLQVGSGRPGQDTLQYVHMHAALEGKHHNHRKTHPLIATANVLVEAPSIVHHGCMEALLQTSAESMRLAMSVPA